MKKIISTILVCVLLVGSLFTLASCGGLSGTYEGTILSLTFSGSEVAINLKGGEAEDAIKASYEIKKEDDKEYFVLTWPEGADIPTEFKSLEGKLPYTKGNDSNKGDYIQLGDGILSLKFYKK